MEQKERDSLRVAIVGGGIGGIALASALVRQGIRVDVYEKAKKLAEVGAGVVLAPNSVRLLNRLGLEQEILRYGARLGADSSYLRSDGSSVAPYWVTDSSGWNAVYGMHRADLLEMLSSLLPANTVHVNHECVEVRQDERAAYLSFSNGRSVEADLVIGCDGIRSSMHSYVGVSTQPVFSGSVAYRGLLPAADVPFLDPELFLWMGEGKHFLTYPVRHGELINYVAFVPTKEQELESWSSPGDPRDLAREFSGWDERVTSLINRLDHTFKWGLYDRNPLSQWTNGRVTLLGDAAHPMLPHLGQGANQAIEDAFALAATVSRIGPMKIEEALSVYEHVRRKRAATIQEESRDNGRRYDSNYKDLESRDLEIASSNEFRAWLFDHDAEQEAETHLNSVTL